MASKTKITEQKMGCTTWLARPPRFGLEDTAEDTSGCVASRTPEGKYTRLEAPSLASRVGVEYVLRAEVAEEEEADSNGPPRLGCCNWDTKRHPDCAITHASGFPHAGKASRLTCKGRIERPRSAHSSAISRDDREATSSPRAKTSTPDAGRRDLPTSMVLMATSNSRTRRL